MMSKQIVVEKMRDIFFENKVVLLFAIICLGAFYASEMTTVLFFGELFTRFGRNTFMVLSLIIPVVAGLGLNFGIVIGAMAAQIAIILVVLWGGSGFTGVLTVAIVATPIAIVFGYLVGRLFNAIKGSEMIGGMVMALFADGFYQFLLLFVMGGIIPIANERLMTGTGVGVLNVIEFGTYPSYMRQVLDDVSIGSIVTVGFWGMVVFIIVTIVSKLVKKQPLRLTESGGLSKPLVVLIVLGLVYGLSFVFWPLNVFISQNRLNGLFAVQWALVGMIVLWLYRFVREKWIEKSGSTPIKPLVHITIAVILSLIVLQPDISHGLNHVGIPVFTYLLIFGMCLFIRWFMSTRLGQNMRTVGQNRVVATSAGINVDRTRIIATILSTLLAAYGQIIILQNFGIMNTYSSHSQVGVYAIAALLVGGATVSRASVKHAIVGVLLFHSLFVLAPLAGTNLMGNALIGEYFRVFAANAVIALALIMHAWQRVKKYRKGQTNEAEPKEAGATA